MTALFRFMEGFRRYKNVGRKAAKYWKMYGGFSEFVRSPYVHVSLVLTLLCTDVWMNRRWWEMVSSVIPSMLGFTLGGLAIFLSFGDEKFKERIAGAAPNETKEHSPYMGLVNTFMHFVLVQACALLWSLIADALHFDLPWNQVAKITRYFGLVGDFLGFWMFLYGLCLSVAAVIAIFDMTSWYDGYQTKRRLKALSQNQEQNGG